VGKQAEIFVDLQRSTFFYGNGGTKFHKKQLNGDRPYFVIDRGVANPVA
jgi:hypothetical protein